MSPWLRFLVALKVIRQTPRLPRSWPQCPRTPICKSRAPTTSRSRKRLVQSSCRQHTRTFYIKGLRTFTHPLYHARSPPLNKRPLARSLRRPPPNTSTTTRKPSLLAATHLLSRRPPRPLNPIPSGHALRHQRGVILRSPKHLLAAHHAVKLQNKQILSAVYFTENAPRLTRLKRVRQSALGLAPPRA